MSNRNQHPDNSAYLAALLALLVTAFLVAAYFLVEFTVKDLSWKGFLQSISGNIIAATLSFLIVYFFITSKNVLGSRNSERQISEYLDLRIKQLREDLSSRIDAVSTQINREIDTKLNLDNNSPFGIRFDGFKTEVLSQMQQMGRRIGEEVNTKLDLDSNELYRFFGLKGIRTGSMFQDFRIYRSDPRRPNDNSVSFLWADTYYGNTINASIKNDDGEPFLRVEFQSFSSKSWGCNIAIRPQNQRASDLSVQEGLKYLVFQAKISEEAEQQDDLLRNIGIAVRLVNGKYQHWDYATYSRQYIHFSIDKIGVWKTICIDLSDKSMWWHFSDDGNPNVHPDEAKCADFSVISAIILKFGEYQPETVGELGAGKGVIDIKRIEFSENYIS